MGDEWLNAKVEEYMEGKQYGLQDSPVRTRVAANIIVCTVAV